MTEQCIGAAMLNVISKIEGYLQNRYTHFDDENRELIFKVQSR